MTTLGEMIAARRHELGMTQAELAAAIPASRSWVGLLEQGHITEPGGTRLIRLAIALDLPTESLVGEAERNAVVLNVQISEARSAASRLLALLTDMDPSLSSEVDEVVRRCAQVLVDELKHRTGLDVNLSTAIEIQAAVNAAVIRNRDDSAWLFGAYLTRNR